MIFVELKDEGINVATQVWSGTAITITLYTPKTIRDEKIYSKKFNTKDTYEYVMMLIDYMNLKYKVNKVLIKVGLLNKVTYNWFPDNASIEIPDVMTDQFIISFYL